MKAFHARKTLAIIDHNYHLYRAPTDKFRRKYNPRSKNWRACAIKTPKDYAYVPMLMAKILEQRRADQGNMQDFMELSMHDAPRIAPTIAHVQPPTVDELCQKAKSRFEKFQSKK